MTSHAVLEPVINFHAYDRVCMLRGYHTVGELREFHAKQHTEAVLVCADCGLPLKGKDILSIRIAKKSER